jgi:hypothetical protein
MEDEKLPESMGPQLLHAQIGDWNCACTIQQLPGKVVDIVVDLTPGGGTLSSRQADFHSRLDVKLALHSDDLRAATSLTQFGASRGAGKNISAFCKFADVTIEDVKSVVISFAGETKRIVLCEEVP